MKRLFLPFLIFIIGQNIYAQKVLSDINQKKLNTVLYYIQNAYVDTVQQDKIVVDAIVGMLKELDPHSVYLSKEELKEMDEPLQGSFDGIGIQFNLLNDSITVVAPIIGGPSERVGILPGDKIVKINGKDFTGPKITNNDVFKSLRGPKGTKVTVSVYRKGEKQLLEFEIIRDKIPIHSIDAAYMVDDKTGYIKLSRFAATSGKEFKKSLLMLKDKGMQNLILDLAGNSGGYLHIAVELADEFIGGVNTIVYTEGVASPRQNYYSTSGNNFEKGKVVVIIDEGSASASEIVSGALQDLDRGIIVGRRSFGKGLAQNAFNLPDGSAIRLTTARYYTPSGRSIQREYKDGVEKYYKELYERYDKGELTSEKSIKFPDSLKFYTKNKRIVYGGGGIMPDFFVPLDTTRNTPYLLNIYKKSLPYKFSLNYTNQNREQLKVKYPTADNFIQNFEVTDNLLKELIKLAEKEGIEPKEEQIEKSKSFLTMQIKALIGRNLFNEEVFYKIINANDPTFQKAISLLKDNTFDKLKISY